MRYDKAYEFLKENEGGFANVKGDSGGATIFGISSKWFKKEYEECMALYKTNKKEALNYAKEFYKKNFWQKEYDAIEDEILAIKIFDLSVNMGDTAIKIIQELLNKKYNYSLKIDGELGGKTVEAINEANKRKDTYSLLTEYQFVIKKHYQSIVEKNPSQAKFLGGWINRTYKLPR